MVGEAYTLRYMPAREDRNAAGVCSSIAVHPQSKAIEEGPPGAMFVVRQPQERACRLGRPRSCVTRSCRPAAVAGT